MGEIPLKSDSQMRGDEFVRNVAEKRLEDILFEKGKKYATRINCILAVEKDRKSCQCRSCSNQRRKQVNTVINSFNWTMDMLNPAKRGIEWVETFDKPIRGWDIKKVIRKRKQ